VISNAFQFLNTPLALLPEWVSIIEQAMKGDPLALFEESRTPPCREKPYDAIAGVAVICIKGALLHGNGWCWEGATYYGEVRRALAEAIGDPDIRAIVLHVDSAGGVVNGCFDLTDDIYAMRGEKPMWAICDEMAASAAYAIASAADRVIVPRTGVVGSIGVICLHTDITEMLDQQGVKITTIQYGARKSDGYPTTKLTTPALKRMQNDIDVLGELFVDTVARNRGLKAKSVRDTEAGTFLGKSGVSVGLADSVMSPDKAFLELVKSIS